ncbi:MAG: MBL fold metallo-hydrolase [Gammaproteobacteria bacterium]|nr:MBL fold metallo-hydrolase [Gammaproteobacteria bacterium]
MRLPIIILKIVLLVLLATSETGCGVQSADNINVQTSPGVLEQIVDQARRIPNRTGWFEILKLPNDVYAFWEPGHAEKVNSFLIVGEFKDLVYDTGMGIASLRDAIADVRAAEGLADKPLMVVLSHNHLDHNGGASEFDEIWTVNQPWAMEKLTQGLPGGIDAGFVPYWSQLTPHPGVEPPGNFSPVEHVIAPVSRARIRFLADGDSIDLGNRSFRVIRTYSHSPDGVVLYDANNQVFFGGDTFYGPNYLVTDLVLLADDLEQARNLPVQWHYSSHGAQLVEVMKHGAHLTVVRKIIAGAGQKSTTTFAGVELPLHELDGVTITLGGSLLVY